MYTVQRINLSVILILLFTYYFKSFCKGYRPLCLCILFTRMSCRPWVVIFLIKLNLPTKDAEKMF